MKIALAIIKIFFVGIFWKIYHDKTAVIDALAVKEDGFQDYIAKITRQRDANKVKELNENKPLGEAGRAVRAFFQAWKAGQYETMRDMIVSPQDDANKFAERLRKATLNWRHVEILSEKPDGDGWKVAFRLEVTSPESAVAAVAIDEAAAYKNLKGEFAAYSLQPLILGIERFASYDLEWRVTKADGKMLIGAYPDKDSKNINLLSYIMNDEIATIRHVGMFQGSGAMPNIQQQIQAIMAMWMMFAGPDLKLEKDRSDKIFQAAAPLIGQGLDNLELMTAGALAAQQQGRVPTIPE